MGDKMWMLHDIGRCYLHLSDYKEAAHFAKESIKLADELKVPKWRVNSRVLLAQATST